MSRNLIHARLGHARPVSFVGRQVLALPDGRTLTHHRIHTNFSCSHIDVFVVREVFAVLDVHSASLRSTLIDQLSDHVCVERALLYEALRILLPKIELPSDYDDHDENELLVDELGVVELCNLLHTPAAEQLCGALAANFWSEIRDTLQRSIDPFAGQHDDEAAKRHSDRWRRLSLSWSSASAAQPLLLRRSSRIRARTTPL